MIRMRVTFSAPFPRCFDSREQFNEWLKCARMAAPLHGLSVCSDCTPRYQYHMVRLHRCENPHVQFDENHEPFVPPDEQDLSPPSDQDR